MVKLPAANARYLLVVESGLGQYGLDILQAAVRLGLKTVLVTSDWERYRKLEERGVSFASAVDLLVELESCDPESILAAIRSRGLIEDVVGVYSGSDYSVETSALVARALGLPGPDPDAVRKARDKALTRRHCVEHGVPAPRAVEVGSAAEVIAALPDVGLPCVVKPPTDSGSIGVRFCRTEAEAVAAYERLARRANDFRGGQLPEYVLVEEYLSGHEVSVELIFDEKPHLLGLTDKVLGPHPNFTEYGGTFPSALGAEAQESCVGVALAALAAVGYRFGAAHVEVKLTTSGPRLIEINPRTGGEPVGNLIRLASGFDVADQLVRLHTGLAPVDYASPYRGAATRFVLPPRAGMVRGVDGVDQAKSSPGVHDVEVRVQVHQSAPSPDSNMGFVGSVTCVGASAAEAALHAANAILQIDVLVD